MKILKPYDLYRLNQWTLSGEGNNTLITEPVRDKSRVLRRLLYSLASSQGPNITYTLWPFKLTYPPLTLVL